MKVVVITNESLKQELLAQGVREGIQVEWLTEIKAIEDADYYIDLLFYPSPRREEQLKALSPATIIINSLQKTLQDLPAGFIRINGWNTFLQRQLIEASGSNEKKPATEELFSLFNKTIEWVPDIPGFITGRVISAIINEAYFTLEEKVSVKEEIDTAMKLGTNYPYGPFEWAEKIGIQNVCELLTGLAKTNSRYIPSALLKKEALLT